MSGAAIGIHDVGVVCVEYLDGDLLWTRASLAGYYSALLNFDGRFETGAHHEVGCHTPIHSMPRLYVADENRTILIVGNSA